MGATGLVPSPAGHRATAREQRQLVEVVSKVELTVAACHSRARSQSDSAASFWAERPRRSGVIARPGSSGVVLMEPLGRSPLEAGGMSGVGTRRRSQLSWDLNRFHVRSDPTGLPGGTETPPTCFWLANIRRWSGLPCDLSLLDSGLVGSAPSSPLRFQRRHRLNLASPPDGGALNEARLMPIYESAASYRPIMWAQRGDFHPAYGCL